MERAAVLAGANLLVGSGRLLQRQIFGQRDDAMQLLAVSLQAAEIHLGQVGRRHPARFDQRRQRGHRLERQILERRGRANHRPGDGQFGVSRALALRLFAGQRRAKGDGRFGIERHIQLAQFFISLEISTGAADSHFILGIGEMQSLDFLGTAQRVFRKLWWRLPAALCLHGGGQGHTGGNGGRNGLQEAAACNRHGSDDTATTSD